MSKEEDKAEPSQHEVNKTLRVLKGERLKYTVRLHLPDKQIIEFQAERLPTIKFFEEDRSLWVYGGTEYDLRPMMKWTEGSIMLIEENKA